MACIEEEEGSKLDNLSAPSILLDFIFFPDDRALNEVK